MENWMNNLFAAIDRKDSEAFVTFLSEDALFRFGNTPQVQGKAHIRKAVTDFFSNITELHHRIIGVWIDDEVVICEGEVTYIRLDFKRITLPFVDIFRMKDELIADYRVFTDISPLST